MIKSLLNRGCSVATRYYQCQQHHLSTAAVGVNKVVIKRKVDRPVNLMCRRDEMITGIKDRFPNAKVTVPLASNNTLHRDDIRTTHASLSAYLDEVFRNYRTNKVYFQTEGNVDRTTFLALRKRIRHNFVYSHSISLNKGDSAVFVTGHRTEIEALLDRVVDILRQSSMVPETIPLTSKELETYQKFSEKILSASERRMIFLDNGELLIRCNEDQQLAALKRKVDQIIQYGACPLKRKVVIKYHTMYRILAAMGLDFANCVCISATVDKKSLLLLGSHTETQIAQAKDRITSIMYRYKTKRYTRTGFDDGFMSIMKKHVDYLTNQPDLEYIIDTNKEHKKSDYFEISFKKSRKDILKILDLSKKSEVIPLPRPLRDLELSDLQDRVLPDWSGVGDLELGYVEGEETLLLFGGTARERRKCKRDLVKFLSDLEKIVNVRVEIPEPHDQYYKIVDNIDLHYARDGVTFIRNNDSINISGTDKDAVEEVVDEIREMIKGLGVRYFSRLKTTGALYDMPQFDQTDKLLSVRELDISPKLQTWALYGPLAHTASLITQLSADKRAFFSDKVSRTVRAADYTTWHRFLVHAQHSNLTNPAVRCMFGEIDSAPGAIRVLGGPGQVEEVLGEFEEIRRDVKEDVGEWVEDVEDYDTYTHVFDLVPGVTHSFKDPEVARYVAAPGVARSFKGLRLAAYCGLGFPNTSIWTNPEHTGLVINSDSPASRQLAEQHTRKFFDDAYSAVTRYVLKANHYTVFHENYTRIKSGLDSICSTHKGFYHLTITNQDHSLLLLAPSTAIPRIVQDIDSLLSQTFNTPRPAHIRYPITTVPGLQKTDRDVTQTLPAHLMGIKSSKSLGESLVIRKLDLGEVNQNIRQNMSSILQQMFSGSSEQVKFDLDDTGSSLNITTTSKLKMMATESRIKKFLEANTHCEEFDLPPMRKFIPEEISRDIKGFSGEKNGPMVYLRTGLFYHGRKIIIVGEETEVAEIRDKISDMDMFKMPVEKSTRVRYENFNFDRSRFGKLDKLKKRILKMYPWLYTVYFEENMTPDGHLAASITVDCPIAAAKTVDDLSSFLSSYSFTNQNEKKSESEREKGQCEYRGGSAVSGRTASPYLVNDPNDPPTPHPPPS